MEYTTKEEIEQAVENEDITTKQAAKLAKDLGISLKDDSDDDNIEEPTPTGKQYAKIKSTATIAGKLMSEPTFMPSDFGDSYVMDIMVGDDVKSVYVPAGFVKNDRRDQLPKLREGATVVIQYVEHTAGVTYFKRAGKDVLSGEAAIKRGNKKVGDKYTTVSKLTVSASTVYQAEQAKIQARIDVAKNVSEEDALAINKKFAGMNIFA